MQKLAFSRLLTVFSTRTFHFPPALVGGALVAQVGSKSCTFDGENEKEKRTFDRGIKKNILFPIFFFAIFQCLFKSKSREPYSDSSLT